MPEVKQYDWSKLMPPQSLKVYKAPKRIKRNRIGGFKKKNKTKLIDKSLFNEQIEHINILRDIM